MASEVIRQRFAGIFQSLDTNGDGFIDETDYEGAITALTERRGVEPGSPEAGEIRDTINSGWEAVRELGDADGDGRVTLEEFVSSLAALTQSPEGLERAGLAIAEQMITAMDSDGDGRLDRNEYREMMGVWGAPEDRMDALFNQLDADGDGFVSREELVGSARRFLQDAAPTDTHLWGPTENG